MSGVQVMEHQVKSWTWFFEAIRTGAKTHDLRLDDRGYKVGDVLRMCEYDPVKGVYTGRTLRAEITFITSSRTPCAFSSAVLPKEYCILSIKRLDGIVPPWGPR